MNVDCDAGCGRPSTVFARDFKQIDHPDEERWEPDGPPRKGCDLHPPAPSEYRYLDGRTARDPDMAKGRL